MRVLLPGASGFIGSAITRALIARGDTVVALGRDLTHGKRLLPDADWRAGDLRTMQSPADWTPLLAGVDAVVNAAGVLQTGLRDDVGRVQSGAIRGLIAAAQEAGIASFVQISATDTAAQADNPFMASKAEADAALTASGLRHTVLRPGLVIGRNAFGGTELLRMAAGLPWVAPHFPDAAPIRCVALDDVVAAVLRALDQPAAMQGSFDLVEAEDHSLGAIIAAHRRWLGLGEPRWRFRIPLRAMRPLSLLADGLGWLGWRSPLRSNAVAALLHGVSGDSRETEAALGRPPLSLDTTLRAMPGAGKADRWHARLALVFPLALASLFVLWLGSGLLGLARTDAAARVLEAGDMAQGPARALVIASSLLDLALAALLALRGTARAALTGMAVVSLGYLAGSLALAPGLWADPLGPMLKVLPVLALTLACLAMVDER